MKRFFVICIGVAAALLAPCQAAQVVRIATVVFTNAPADGNKITINGVDRVAKTVVGSPSTQFQIGGTTNISAANLWTQLQSYPLTDISASQSGGTVFLVGRADAAMTATMTGTWGTVTVSTLPLTNYTGVWPIESYPAASRMPLANMMINAISTYPTNRVSATALAFLNYFSLSQSNNITGGNLFSGANLLNGANVFTNAGQIFGGGIIFGARGTNMSEIYTTNLFATNATFRGNINIWNGFGTSVLDFLTDGAAANEKRAKIKVSSGTAGLSFVFSSDDQIIQNTALRLERSGASATMATFFTPVVLANGPLTNSYLSNCFGGFSQLYAVAGLLNGLQISNVVGLHGALTKLSGGYLDGVGATNLVSTNGTFKGQSIFTGDLATTETLNSSLANGPNVAVNFGTTSFVTLISGPSAAFTIGGIAGGHDGAKITIFNHTGQAMTIANDNTDPTAVNRILTLTGADVSTTGDGSVTLTYSPTAGRWILSASAL